MTPNYIPFFGLSILSIFFFLKTNLLFKLLNIRVPVSQFHMRLVVRFLTTGSDHVAVVEGQSRHVAENMKSQRGYDYCISANKRCC